MTIETAIPTSAETLAALFDQLVDAVAQRVLAKVDERIANELEKFVQDELDSKIDEWAMNYLNDRVGEYVTIDSSSLDLHDEVLEIVQDLTFNVRVSR